MKAILIGLITLYQKCISRFTAPRCRFYPTCSHYAKTVLQQQPIYKAIGLIVWRLLRCQPLCAGGFDYPPKSNKNKTKMVSRPGETTDILKDVL